MSPAQIGQYRIVRQLAVGGMGTVYLGEHILLGRRAAIKTLLPALSSHAEIVERFFNEARAMSAISDPGIVQIFDFGYHVDGTAYIVMELLEGETLAQRIERLGRLPLVETLHLGRQIVSSLAAAHARGIIHRDLKPSNVVVIRDAEAYGGERTKILDFGVAKLTGPTDAIITQAGTMLGTPVYMSPEQCRGHGKVDHRSDIYSVGCALFHMLTGRPPFDCETAGDFIAAHLKDDPPVPSSLVPVPPAIDVLLARCLAKHPEARFQSMPELQDAIESVLGNLDDPTHIVTPRSIPIPPAPPSTGTTPVPASLLTPPPAPPPPVTHASPSARQRASSDPAHRWFLDPHDLDAMPDGIDDDPYLPASSRMPLAQRAALVLALVVGVIGGLVFASAALGEDDEIAAEPPPLPSVAHVEEIRSTPATRTVHELAPPESIAELQEALDDPAPDPTARIDRAPPAPPQTSRRPRPQRAWRPQRTRRPPAGPVTSPRGESGPVTSPHPDPGADTSPLTEEDLYETR